MSSFSLSGGVEVLGFISPTDTNDTYPVIDPLYGIDGLRNVNSLSDLNNIPQPRRRAGMVVGISGGTTYYKLNNPPWNYTISDWSIFNSGGSSGDFLPLSGGTVTGGTVFTQGLTANTVSATTYLNLPIDLTITGFSYSNNTFTITNNSGNTLSATINNVTGLTVNGVLSATTYQNLPTDIRVTGGTYSNGSAIFTNNTGGTFNVSGFYTGGTDVFVTGATYNNNTFTYTNNTGGTFNVLFNAVTGLTSTGTISSSVISATTYQNLPSTSITVGTTPIVSGTAGRILFQSTGNTVQQDGELFWDNTNKKLGIGKTPAASSAKAVVAITDATANQNFYLTLRNLSAGYGSWGFVKLGSNDLGINYQTDSDVPQGGTSIRFYYGGQIGITSSVSIGNIGTPSARLDVRAQGALSSDIGLRLRNSADNANLLKVAGNGNFTIGLDSSYHVSFDPTSPSLRGRSSDGSTVTWQLSNWSNENCWITNNSSGQVLVGIGTAAPTDKLHIYSTVNDYKIKIAVGAGTPSDESCGIKFTTTWAGTSFGGDAVQIIARSKGSGNTTSQKSSLEFLLNSGGTTSLRASITSQSNLLLQSPTEDTNDKGVIYVPNGTAPTGSTTDGYKQYSSDIVAGNAVPHFRTENGSIIKLYQETTGVTASTLVGGGGTTITDTDTFDGYTLQQVVKALKNLGILQ